MSSWAVCRDKVHVLEQNCTRKSPNRFQIDNSDQIEKANIKSVNQGKCEISVIFHGGMSHVNLDHSFEFEKLTIVDGIMEFLLDFQNDNTKGFLVTRLFRSFTIT